MKKHTINAERWIKRKEWKMVSQRLHPDVIELLDAIAKETGYCGRSEVMRVALSEFLDKHFPGLVPTHCLVSERSGVHYFNRVRQAADAVAKREKRGKKGKKWAPVVSA